VISTAGFSVIDGATIAGFVRSSPFAPDPTAAAASQECVAARTASISAGSDERIVTEYST
jgi:hypothetical protein